MSAIKEAGKPVARIARNFELKGEMSARRILHAPSLSDRKSFRGRYLLPAPGHALVEIALPESPRARNQRYRLTARGRAVSR